MTGAKMVAMRVSITVVMMGDCTAVKMVVMTVSCLVEMKVV